MSQLDVVIVGSGPNGLAAGIELQRNGLEVLIVEASKSIGGGTRTSELTLPGFKHDYCSAVHPMGFLSPFFQTLPLSEHGLEWIFPEASVAHPLDNEPAVMLYKSIDETINSIGGNDGKRWAELIQPFLKNADALFKDALGPLKFPADPLTLMKFGLKGMLPATYLSNKTFKQERAKALFAGCAAHSILPLESFFSSAVGLMFAISGHIVNWPIAKGGSKAIGEALASYFTELGGKIETNHPISKMGDLPESKYYFFDTDPMQLLSIAGGQFSNSYNKRLKKYNYGPGVFKIDWALSSSIPWKDQNCLKASTVHVGATLGEIGKSEKNAWNGKHSDSPFVMVCQQSQFDSTRTPEGMHTGYAYCHVPNGSSKDMTIEIERQIERFAPGFRDIILERRTTGTAQFYDYNRNFLGGAITGGAANVSQLFTRPVARLNPYSTPDPRIFICSSSTPPGGGVHGMCGYWAAQSLINNLFRNQK